MTPEAQAVLAVLGENGERWAKGSYAISAEHGPQTVVLSDTTHFCFAAACRCAFPDMNIPILTRARSLVGCELWRWNDAPERTWADVRALLERL